MVRRRVRADNCRLKVGLRRGVAHRQEGLRADGVSGVKPPGVVWAAVRRVNGGGKGKHPVVGQAMDLRIFNK